MNKTDKKSNKHILVVDDDVSILDAIRLILEDAYQVSTVFKGEETVNKVIKTRPDLILLDVLMSGGDGREICKSLKRNIKTRSIPIIMISAHSSAHKSIKECGADDFLAKPFEMGDLLKKLKKFV